MISHQLLDFKKYVKVLCDIKKLTKMKKSVD